MTTSTFHSVTSAPAGALRPLLAVFSHITRSVRATLANFNRYMDAAHKVQENDLTSVAKKNNQ